MIRSSALLTLVAMAMLVAGVFSASLGLIYASIAVSILAALTLGAGVLLRRRELFGEAAAGDVRPGWAAAGATGARSAEPRPDGAEPASAGPLADVRQAAGDGARTDRRDGREKDGDLAEGQRKARSGAASGSGLWPGSIAAKGASVADSRGGEHPAPGREKAGTGPERDRGWPPRDREQAAARAQSGPADRDKDAAARTGTGQAGAEAEPAGRRGRDQAAPGRDKEATAARAEAFRLPSAQERAARARDDTGRGGRADAPAASNEPRDRDEISGSGKGPVRPAWPSTAGPRAAAAGSAARYGRAETEDEEPEAARSPAGHRPAEPKSRGGDASRPADRLDEADGQAERGAPDESRGNRIVPRYADDLTRPKRDREPAASGSGDLPVREETPAGEESEAEEDAGTVAGTAGRDAGTAWSAWSSFRATPAGERAASGGRAHHEPGEVDEQRDEDERGPGDERDGAGADKLAVPGATPGAAADAGGTDEAAGSDTEDDEAGDASEPGEAGAATDTAGSAAPGTAGGAAATSDEGAADPTADAAETDRAGQVDHAAEDDRAANRDGAGTEDGAEGTTPGQDGAGAEDAAEADEVTIVPGVARYHRRGCILIRFLSDGDLETMTRREAEAGGSVPCKACQPDKPDPSG